MPSHNLKYRSIKGKLIIIIIIIIIIMMIIIVIIIIIIYIAQSSTECSIVLVHSTMMRL